MWMYLKNSSPFDCVALLRRWIIARRFWASLLWRSPSSLAFAIGCGAFAISESFSNPVALWVYQNGDRYLILPSPPVFPILILHPLDIPMFFGSSSPARNHLPPGANVPGASAELLTRAQNGAEARSMWPQQEVLGRVHLDVSKNRGTPKWMVYNGKPY